MPTELLLLALGAVLLAGHHRVMPPLDPVETVDEPYPIESDKTKVVGPAAEIEARLAALEGA